jgi:hypothetical protein
VFKTLILGITALALSVAPASAKTGFSITFGNEYSNYDQQCYRNQILVQDNYGRRYCMDRNEYQRRYNNYYRNQYNNSYYNYNRLEQHNRGEHYMDHHGIHHYTDQYDRNMENDNGE